MSEIHFLLLINIVHKHYFFFFLNTTDNPFNT